MKNDNHNAEPRERRVDNAELAAQVAVLETIVSRAQEDMKELAELLREHMLKEEEERKELLRLLSFITKEQEKYKNFIGGIIITVSAIFTVGGAIFGLAYNYLAKHP